MKMKRVAGIVSFGLSLGLLTGVSLSAAQVGTVTTSKTTTYSGVVSAIDPAVSTIVLESKASSTPVTYTYSKETAFVDANGNVVSAAVVRNSPVTVEYTIEGGQMIVRKVSQTRATVTATPPGAAVPENTVIHTETETR